MTRATDSNPAVRIAAASRAARRLAAGFAAVAVLMVPAILASGASAATAPEGRGYEMVSPADKNFGDISIGSEFLGGISAAHSGEAASFCTQAGISDKSSGTGCGDYVSRRNAVSQRWETTAVAPPYCTIDNSDPTYVWASNAQFQKTISADMRKVVSWLPEGGGGCPFAPLDPAAPAPSMNLYLFEEVGNPASARLIAPEPGFPTFSSRLQTAAGNYEAGSPDLSHIVFASNGQQTPEVPADGQSRLFEWADGTVRLLTRDPANVPFADASQLATPMPAYGVYDRYNAVSADGSRIFFVSPAPGFYPGSVDTEIYMRENGAITHHVSESECTSSCGSPSFHEFQYATPDGEKVFFRSPERLTDDPTPSGANLYMYTHSADPASDQNLTLLTQDDEPADGTVTTTNLPPGVIGTSDDGDDVYFVANGQLVAGESTAETVQNGQRLYRWQANDGNPQLSFLATLSGTADGLNWSEGEPNPDRYVTADGEHLIVGTVVALDPVADPNANNRDVYRWSEADGWTCVSCTAVAQNFESFVFEEVDFGPPRQTRRERRPISDDGSRVFFQSFGALVPRDTNRKRDVYMWEDGTVSLVTSGKSPEVTYWIGASADGDDVFFTTRERLVGWDTDNNNDLYDARVGGGFPEPPPAPVACSGEECQKPPAAPPAAPGSGSSDFNGSGNLGSSARASITGIRGLSAAARSALARGGKARLKLKVNRAGKVTVVGTARVAKKRSRVLSSSERAKKAGSVTVRFALSRSARAELRRKGSLTVALTVRFRDARPKAITFTVRSATSKKGRRS